MNVSPSSFESIFLVALLSFLLMSALPVVRPASAQASSPLPSRPSQLTPEAQCLSHSYFVICIGPTANNSEMKTFFYPLETFASNYNEGPALRASSANNAGGGRAFATLAGTYLVVCVGCGASGDVLGAAAASKEVWYLDVALYFQCEVEGTTSSPRNRHCDPLRLKWVRFPVVLPEPRFLASLAFVPFTGHFGTVRGALLVVGGVNANTGANATTALAIPVTAGSRHLLVTLDSEGREPGWTTSHFPDFVAGMADAALGVFHNLQRVMVFYNGSSAYGAPAPGIPWTTYTTGAFDAATMKLEFGPPTEFPGWVDWPPNGGSGYRMTNVVVDGAIAFFASPLGQFFVASASISSYSFRTDATLYGATNGPAGAISQIFMIPPGSSFGENPALIASFLIDGGVSVAPISLYPSVAPTVGLRYSNPVGDEVHIELKVTCYYADVRNIRFSVGPDCSTPVSKSVASVPCSLAALATVDVYAPADSRYMTICMDRGRCQYGTTSGDRPVDAATPPCASLVNTIPQCLNQVCCVNFFQQDNNTAICLAPGSTARFVEEFVPAGILQLSLPGTVTESREITATRTIEVKPTTSTTSGTSSTTTKPATSTTTSETTTTTSARPPSTTTTTSSGPTLSPPPHPTGTATSSVKPHEETTTTTTTSATTLPPTTTTTTTTTVTTSTTLTSTTSTTSETSTTTSTTTVATSATTSSTTEDPSNNNNHGAGSNADRPFWQKLEIPIIASSAGVAFSILLLLGYMIYKRREDSNKGGSSRGSAGGGSNSGRRAGSDRGSNRGAAPAGGGAVTPRVRPKVGSSDPMSIIPQFAFVNKIGRGGFCDVFCVRRKTDGEVYALKVYRLHSVPDSSDEEAAVAAAAASAAAGMVGAAAGPNASLYSARGDDDDDSPPNPLPGASGSFKSASGAVAVNNDSSLRPPLTSAISQQQQRLSTGLEQQPVLSSNIDASSAQGSVLSNAFNQGRRPIVRMQTLQKVGALAFKEQRIMRKLHRETNGRVVRPIEVYVHGNMDGTGGTMGASSGGGGGGGSGRDNGNNGGAGDDQQHVTDPKSSSSAGRVSVSMPETSINRGSATPRKKSSLLLAESAPLLTANTAELATAYGGGDTMDQISALAAAAMGMKNDTADPLQPISYAGSLVAGLFELVPDGNFQQYLRSFRDAGKPAPVKSILRVLAQLADVLHIMFVRNSGIVVHGDIKAENILLKLHAGTLVLGDFGTAVEYRRTIRRTTGGGTTTTTAGAGATTSSAAAGAGKDADPNLAYVGTFIGPAMGRALSLVYAPPERIQSNIGADPTIDWWSFGVLCYICFAPTGKHARTMAIDMTRANRSSSMSLATASAVNILDAQQQEEDERNRDGGNNSKKKSSGSAFSVPMEVKLLQDELVAEVVAGGMSEKLARRVMIPCLSPVPERRLNPRAAREMLHQAVMDHFPQAANMSPNSVLPGLYYAASGLPGEADPIPFELPPKHSSVREG